MTKNLKIKIKSKNKDISIPSYETNSSAGLDLRAYLPEGNIKLSPKETKLIGTGLYFEIPEGFEVQIRPRSGLALKNGVSVLNSPGTIDADYRGEIGVILVNLSNNSFTINPGERIAQLVIAKYEQVSWNLTESLDITERGSGGFGSTGKK